jgi:hypothetical protein
VVIEYTLQIFQKKHLSWSENIFYYRKKVYYFVLIRTWVLNNFFDPLSVYENFRQALIYIYIYILRERQAMSWWYSIWVLIKSFKVHHRVIPSSVSTVQTPKMEPPSLMVKSPQELKKPSKASISLTSAKGPK